MPARCHRFHTPDKVFLHQEPHRSPINGHTSKVPFNQTALRRGRRHMQHVSCQKGGTVSRQVLSGSQR